MITAELIKINLDCENERYLRSSVEIHMADLPISLQVTHKPKRDYGHYNHNHPKHHGLDGGLGGESPWFQPPPISPDLPPLFYGDAHKDGKGRSKYGVHKILILFSPPSHSLAVNLSHSSPRLCTEWLQKV